MCVKALADEEGATEHLNMEDFEGRGESTPTAYFYQNVGEAEYSVALFQYMVLIGYDPKKISKEDSWTWKNGTQGTVYKTHLDKGFDIDYVKFLIKQKVKNLNYN